MPTEIAAQKSVRGWVSSVPSATSRLRASCKATYPPHIDAVLVPPSACRTSQSIVTSRSPNDFISHTALNARPIKRSISKVRPFCFPFFASRETRSWLDPGSIEYSAVTQPSPFPRIHLGTSSSIETVHSTLVRPKLTRTEPAG